MSEKDAASAQLGGRYTFRNGKLAWMSDSSLKKIRDRYPAEAKRSLKEFCDSSSANQFEAKVVQFLDEPASIALCHHCPGWKHSFWASLLLNAIRNALWLGQHQIMAEANSDDGWCLLISARKGTESWMVLELATSTSKIICEKPS